MRSSVLLSAQVGTAHLEPAEDSTAVLSLDEGRVPFGRVELTVPYDPATVGVLDPRDDPRLIVHLERRFSGSDPVSVLSAEFAGKKASDVSAAWAGLRAADITGRYGHPWNAFGFRATQRRRMDLSIRSRRVDHAAGTVALVAATDEALLQDYALLSATPISPSVLTVRGAVELALSRAVPGAVLPGAEGAQTITAESAVWQPGVSAWDYLSSLTASAGLRLWCDEARVWHLAAPETIITPGQVSLAADQSVTAATDTISRDESLWADGVVVTYTWTDASNVRQVRHDVAGDANASRVLHVELNRPYPRAGEAAARLRKLRALGRVLDVEAVADPSVYPAMAASLTVPGTPLQSGWVSSVTWRVPEDRMTVTTRELIDVPTTAWAFLPAGIAWNKSPVGVSWLDPDPDPAEVA